MKKLLLLLLLLTAPAFTIPLSYESFCNRYLEEAQAVEYATGVPASILFSQAILESGAGRSNIAKRTLNFFGLKCGDNWKGDYYSTSSGCYRSYSSIEESFLDYACFLSDNYSGAVSKNWRHWARYGSGYGEASDYWEKVGKIIKLYDLDKYERTKD